MSSAGIVGTVSQSGGVPTGAIIESGSNANGTYTRFADGTQICTRTVSYTGISVSNPRGALFFANYIPPVQFAAPFIYPPEFSKLDIVSNTGLTWATTAVVATATTTHGVYPVGLLNEVIAATFFYFAKGRWF
ncbi:hypothetical protein D3C77_575420 [compost metagenome]